MLARTMHGIDYDPIHDEFMVPNHFGQALLVYRGSASGEEAPIRVIQGPATQMNDPDKVDVDPVHNEIFVIDGSWVLVFPREANGNVAPIRILKSPEPKLMNYSLAVDPVGNFVIMAGKGRDGTGAIFIFNRTDQGDAKPRGVIRGPKSGITGTFGLRAQPTRGLFLMAMPGPDYSFHYDKSFVGVWSVHDNGDVPPRWTIGGPDGMLKQPRGLDLDPKNKTVIIADKVLNAVITYSFPEIF